MKNFIALLFLQFCFSQAPNVQWDKTFGGSSKEVLKHVVPTANGYLLYGYSNSPVSGDKQQVNGVNNTNDIWVLSTNTNFEIQQQNCYTHSNPNNQFLNDYDSNYHIQDNKIVFASTFLDIDIEVTKIRTFDYVTQSYDNFQPGGVISCGTLLYNSYWDTAITDFFKTSDNNYIYTATNGWVMPTCLSINSSNYLIQKSSSTNYNSVLWSKEYGGNGYEKLKATLKNPTGYVLAGSSNSNISQDKTENSRGGLDFWILQTDNLGNIVWQKTIGGNGTDTVTSALLLNDGYLIGGSSSSNISGEKLENSIGGSDYWIVKLDFTGNIIWQKTIGGSQEDKLQRIIPTNDGNYLLIGNSNSNSSGHKTENSKGLYDAWLVKINTLGTILWDKTIGGNLDESISDVLQTPDNGYVLALTSHSSISGDKTQNAIGESDYWMVKLMPDNLQNESFFSNTFTIFPIPTNNQITIKNTFNKKIDSIQIFTITGSVLKKIPTENIDTISISELKTGIYIIEIIAENVVHNYKIIKI